MRQFVSKKRWVRKKLKKIHTYWQMKIWWIQRVDNNDGTVWVTQTINTKTKRRNRVFTRTEGRFHVKQWLRRLLFLPQTTQIYTDKVFDYELGELYKLYNLSNLWNLWDTNNGLSGLRRLTLTTNYANYTNYTIWVICGICGTPTTD